MKNSTRNIFIRNLFRVVLFGIALCVFAVPLYAAPGINDEIPFQGVLKDDSGNLLDGTYDMVFRIHDAATGGNTLWTGTYTAANGNPVTVTDGIFRVMLGSGTGNTFGIDFSDDNYYLGLSIEGDSEMTPRQRLGSAPYAFNSERLDGLDSTDFLRSDQANATATISSLTFTNATGSSLAIGAELITDFSGAGLVVVGNALTATVTAAELNSIDTGANDECLTYQDGNFEWQVCGSASTLDALTDVDTTGAASGTVLVYDATLSEWVVRATSTLGISGGSGTVNSGLTGQIAYYAGDGTAITGTSSIFINTDGNIGIGTTSPTTALTVGGTIGASAAALGDGTVGAPSVTVGDSNSGLYSANPFQVNLSIAGTDSFRWYNGGFIVKGDLPIGWSNNSTNSTAGNALTLYRDADDILAQRRGTNAQVFRLYNTYTDSSNYERVSFNWSGDLFTLGTEHAGTGVARELAFQTGGTEQIRIDTNGRIGIGTTSPSSKLDIFGTSPAGAALTASIKNTTNTGYAQFVTFNDSDIYTGFTTYGSNHADANLRNAGQIFSPSILYLSANTEDESGGAGEIRFTTGGFDTTVTTRAVIDSSGRFGIGTSSPSSKLDVWGDFRVGTSSIPALLVNTNTNNVAIGTSTRSDHALELNGRINAPSNGGAGGYISTGNFGNGGDEAYFPLGLQTDLASDSHLYGTIYTAGILRDCCGAWYIENDGDVYFNTPGNFGIGTTTPSDLFTVSTSSSATAAVLRQYGTGDILNAYDGNVEVFTIVDGGSVGVGTSSPTERLHVLGNIKTPDTGFFKNTRIDDSGIYRNTPASALYGFGNLSSGGAYSLVLRSGTGSSTSHYTGFSFDTAGSGSDFPIGITAYDGFLWIADSTDAEIYKFESDGTYTGTSFDTAGSGNGAPGGILAYQEYFWVTDTADDEVYKYETDGTYTSVSFDTAASGNDQPYGIEAHNGYLWIVGGNDAEVFQHTLNGTYTGTSFDTAASGNGNPRGITYNNGHFWISDLTDNRVYQYTTDGTYTGYSFAAVSNGTLTFTSYNGYLWGSDSADDEIYRYTTGTSTGGYIAFDTDGSERLRIDSSGNVGVGTTSPWKQFSVAGDMSLTGALFDSNNISGTNGMVLQTTGTGVQWVATSSLGLGGGGGATTLNDLTDVDTTGAATGTVLVYDGSLNQWVVRATSTLALDLSDTLGTLAPTRGGTGLATITENQLLIGGAGDTWTQIATSSLGIRESLFTDSGATTYLTSLSDNLAIGTSTAEGFVTVATSSGIAAFVVSQDGTGDILNIFNTNTEAFTILNNGNVGIGTSSPTERLEVAGNIKTLQTGFFKDLRIDDSGIYRNSSADGIYGFGNQTTGGAFPVVLRTGTGSSTSHYTGVHFNTASVSNTEPRGITYHDNYFWVVDSTDALVYQYTTDGTPTGLTFALNASNTNARGITYHNGSFWVTDLTGAEIYQYSESGTFIDSFDTGFTGNGSPYDLIAYDGYFYITDQTDDEVYRYNFDGTYTSYSFDTAAVGNGQPQGIEYYNGFFWIVDLADTAVYKFHTDGSYTGYEFDTTIGAANDFPLGIAAYNGYLYVVDNIDDEVYQYTTATSTGGYIAFETDGGERLRIDASGNIGIGTTTPSAQLTTTGTVRFANFGAGTLQTDAAGNVSVSSDERLKNILGPLESGLTEVLKLEPVIFKWNELSGLETEHTYGGFSAQNVASSIPEAVGIDKHGFLTLSDRPILAAVVNAVQEIWTALMANTTKIESVESENRELEERVRILEERLGIEHIPQEEPPPTSEEPDTELDVPEIHATSTENPTTTPSALKEKVVLIATSSSATSSEEAESSDTGEEANPVSETEVEEIVEETPAEEPDVSEEGPESPPEPLAVEMAEETP